MIYSETTKRAIEIARFAFNEMMAAQIAPTPPNFTVWYEFHSGRNAALRKAIEELKANGSIGADEMRSIYEQFFTEQITGTDLATWGARIQATASQIIEALASAGTNTAHYGEALKDFSGNIAGATNVADIRGLVEGIMDATKVMDGHVRRLQSQVEGSTQQIVDLREKLEASRKEALTDALTGLANRKCFDERLLAASKTADQDDEALCLVLADIDNFKLLNDRFGHGFGDQVLKLVAHTLIQGIKGRDTASRFGGEEFALILPNTPLQGAVTVAESLRKAIAAKKLARKGETKTIGTVTLSFGVTQYTIGEPIDIVVRRADELLYRAKRLGKNRVIAEAGPVSVAKAG